MANITYTIEVTEENANKIQAINDILLGGTKVTSLTVDESTKTVKAKVVEEKAEVLTKEIEEATPAITIDDIKRATKKAKVAYGEDFVNAVFDEFGVKEANQLGRRVSAIDASDYADVLEMLNAGPKGFEKAQTAQQETDLEETDLEETDLEEADLEDDNLEDDDLEDDDSDETEVTAEAVKTALKAYAKEKGRDKAKDIMTKNGAAALSKVDECTQKQLNAMFKELV